MQCIVLHRILPNISTLYEGTSSAHLCYVLNNGGIWRVHKCFVGHKEMFLQKLLQLTLHRLVGEGIVPKPNDRRTEMRFEFGLEIDLSIRSIVELREKNIGIVETTQGDDRLGYMFLALG